MSAVTNEEAQQAGQRSYGLQLLERAKIPHRHPVAVFARWYDQFQSGHLLPDELVLLAQPGVRHLLKWTRHVEPVEIDGLVDFYVISQGDELELAGVSADDLREGWMSETVDEEFIESRYNEAVTASILRKPMFSRGAMPTVKRAFIKQYRGVFPLFAETQSRLRLAIVAAETYVEIDDE